MRSPALGLVVWALLALQPHCARGRGRRRRSYRPGNKHGDDATAVCAPSTTAALSRGVALYGEGRRAEALVSLRRAVQAEPPCYAGCDLLGRVLSSGPSRLAEAERWLRVSVAVEP